jgi:hypothetical protein
MGRIEVIRGGTLQLRPAVQQLAGGVLGGSLQRHHCMTAARPQPACPPRGGKPEVDRVEVSVGLVHGAGRPELRRSQLGGKGQLVERTLVIGL